LQNAIRLFEIEGIAMKITTYKIKFRLLLALLLGISYLQAFAAAKSDSATAQYNAAVAAQNKAQFDAAAQQWRDFLKQYQSDPRCNRASHYLGVSLLKSGKNEQAAAQLQSTLKNYPKFELTEATYLALGEAQYAVAEAGNGAESGNRDAYKAAGESFAALLREYPQSKYAPEALYYLGECAYSRGDKEESVRLFSQFLKQHPDNPLAADVVYAMGVSQEELGDFEAAANTYKMFLEKHPQSPLAAEVLVRQALCQTRLKRYDLAAALYAAAAEKYPQGPYPDWAVRGAHWTAQTMLKDNRPEDARKFLKQVLAGFQKGRLPPQLLVDQADAVYADAGTREEAAELYASIARQYPDDPSAQDASRMEAVCHFQIAEQAYAHDDFQKAAERYAAARDKAGDTELGQWAALMLGWSYYRAGRYSEARQAFAGQRASWPRGQLAADAAFMEAECLWKLDKIPDAIKLYREVIAAYPQSDKAAIAKQRVLGIEK
jgi:cellulose synthase operon protein C